MRFHRIVLLALLLHRSPVSAADDRRPLQADLHPVNEGAEVATITFSNRMDFPLYIDGTIESETTSQPCPPMSYDTNRLTEYKHPTIGSITELPDHFAKHFTKIPIYLCYYRKKGN